jgi:hypothetical protein
MFLFIAKGKKKLTTESIVQLDPLYEKTKSTSIEYAGRDIPEPLHLQLGTTHAATSHHFRRFTHVSHWIHFRITPTRNPPSHRKINS